MKEDKDAHTENGFEDIERLTEASCEEGDGGEASGVAERPEDAIARLTASLASKTREAEENYARFLRSVADIDNLRKRTEKERAETITLANETLITELLPVIDNLERAFEHSTESSGNANALREGVRLTLGNLYAILKRFGLAEVKALGERFDPAVHHAISHDTTEGVETGLVTKEFQKGFFLKGKLIRPSMVAVAGKTDDDGV